MTTSPATPRCDRHGPMSRDESLSEWFCVKCGRAISDREIARLGGDPSKIVVT